MFIIAAACAWCLHASAADRMEQAPAGLVGVGIDEKRGARTPMMREFTDEDGRTVRFKELVNGKPAILMLGYYECPMLCSLVLNGLVDTLRDMRWTPGNEFDVIFVSINPRESHTLAKLKKQNYVKSYGRPQSAAGWHFLTGEEPDIRALARAAGFNYKFDKKQNQYAHAAALMFLTPDGRVSSYMSGVKYDPKAVRLALFKASNGKIGSASDKIYLSCYHYDAAAGTYAPAAVKIMQFGGLLTLIALGLVVGGYWVNERARKSS